MATTQPQPILRGLAWHKEALAFVRGLDKKLRGHIYGVNMRTETPEWTGVDKSPSSVH